MAASEGNLSNNAAVWLHPGRKIMCMTLQNGQVCVEQGDLHGHYETYSNLGVQQWCLIICFSARNFFGSCFESQAPHHLKPLGKGVYRTHNNQQIFVTNDIDNPVTVGLPCNSISCAYPDFLCQHEFVYCHPSKAEECLRLGWKGGIDPKVSFGGKEPTGKWSFHDFPEIHETPTGIDRSRQILSVTFHCKGEESKESTTLYGVVAGTTDVYRAIGCTYPWGNRIYVDKELEILYDWHIVLVCVQMAQ